MFTIFVSLWGGDDGRRLQVLLQISIHPQLSDYQHFPYGSLTINDHGITAQYHQGLKSGDILVLLLLTGKS